MRLISRELIDIEKYLDKWFFSCSVESQIKILDIPLSVYEVDIMEFNIPEYWNERNIEGKAKLHDINNK